EDAAFAPAELPTIDVRVEVLEELGADAHVIFEVEAAPITAEKLDPHEEEATLLAVENAFFTARVDPRTAARQGGPLRLAVDPARFHFFDAETGRTLLAGLAAAEPAQAAAPAAG